MHLASLSENDANKNSNELFVSSTIKCDLSYKTFKFKVELVVINVP